jgi:hypothetical protein
MHTARNDASTVAPAAPEALTEPGAVERAWRFASEEASIALRNWRTAGAALKGDAYAVYVAAADRESAAIDHLRRHAGERRPHSNPEE